jgi:hypothetical protein
MREAIWLAIEKIMFCGGLILGVVEYKYTYRNVYFTILAPVKNLICRPYAEKHAKL